jgi:hypothetical protein
MAVTGNDGGLAAEQGGDGVLGQDLRGLVEHDDVEERAICR